MANPLEGRVATIEVQTAAGPPAVYAMLGEGTSFDKTGTRAVTQTAVFGTATKRVATATKDATATIAVLANPVDPGQVAVNAAYDNGTFLTLRIRPDGLLGYTGVFLVSGRRHSMSPDNGFQTVSYDFALDGDETIEVGGFIL